jgi:hypothetical protein
MDTQDCLAHYPFVVVRIRCRVCARKGSYRLARIAAKYGPEITLRDLLDRFSYDCLWRTQSRTKRGRTDCGVYLPDLEQPRPPDLPPGMVKFHPAFSIDGIDDGLLDAMGQLQSLSESIMRDCIVFAA